MNTRAEAKLILLDMLHGAEQDARQEVFERLLQTTDMPERVRMLTLLDAMGEACRALRIAIERLERF